ncbi:uncharacterized protein LOC126092563 isoform X2 [Schistocerca cancellata]|nr:uncharacterized protein LOC126092563 isoform X2 [Schistocerca cancellata]
METYSLLRTVPVFADVRRRVRRSYHSLKHVHTSLRLGLQLVEVFFQLVLLFSWPLIILCYIPIVVTDRILHHLLASLIEWFPAIMWPAADVYRALPDFVLSFTIGRVIVFFLLLISYIVTFVIECLKVPLNVILFFLSAVSEETAKPFEGLRLSPHAHHSHSSAHPYGHVYSPDVPWLSATPLPPPASPPTPPRTVVLPGAQRGPVRVVEAVTRE